MKELVACLVAVSLSTILGAGALDLEQSFDASVAAGHPLAAESAFRKLAVEKPSTAAIRYFRAAEVARELGNGSLYRDRLSHFLHSEKGWSAEVEQALRYLCRVDPQADRFARMAKNVPHDEALFRVGLRMLGRLREVRRGDEFVRLADALLGTFTAKAQREEILRQIVGMVQVGAPGFPHAALAEVLSRYPLADSQTFREFTWNRKEYGPEWMLTYCDRHKCLWQRPAEYALEIIQGGAWGKDRELAAKRDHLLSLFAKRETDCFGANVPPIVPSLYYRTAIRCPKLFFSDASTNEQAGVWASHQAAQLFKRMASESGCSTDQLSEMFNDSINCRIWPRKDIRSIVGGAKTYGTARALLTRGPEGDLLAEAVKSKSAAKLTAFIREAKFLYKWGSIFKDVGLQEHAQAKADEGLKRIADVFELSAHNALERAVLEEAYEARWNLFLVKDDLRNAIATCNGLVRRFPDTVLADRAFMQIANARLQEKTAESLRSALQVLGAIINLPNSALKAEAQFRIGEVLEEQARMGQEDGKKPDFAPAILAFNRCAETYPSSSFAGESYKRMVDYNVSIRNYSTAVEILEQVFQDYPDAPWLDEMLLKWGIVKNRMGDREGAKEKFRQLIEEYPGGKSAKTAAGFLKRLGD